MARKRNRWFSFRDTNSDEYDIIPLSAPEYVRAEIRGRTATAAGRSGTIWVPDDAYESVTIKQRCYVPRSCIVEVKQWLCGEGWLSFSDIPDYAYRARCIKEVRFSYAIQGIAPLYLAEIEFECDPWQYFYPQPPKIILPIEGSSILNPGTAVSQPMITIVGSGSFSLTIGLQTMWFTDIEDGIIVDSELMDALTLDQSTLINNKISGDLFKIQPGINIVTWSLDTNASVISAMMTPRWRCL